MRGLLALEAKWTGGPLPKNPPTQKSSHAKSSQNPSSEGVAAFVKGHKLS